MTSSKDFKQKSLEKIGWQSALLLHLNKDNLHSDFLAFLPLLPLLSSNSRLCYICECDDRDLIFFLSMFKDDLGGKACFKVPSASFNIQTFKCGL